MDFITRVPMKRPLLINYNLIKVVDNIQLQCTWFRHYKYVGWSCVFKKKNSLPIVVSLFFRENNISN